MFSYLNCNFLADELTVDKLKDYLSIYLSIYLYIYLSIYWSEGADNRSKQTEKAGYINKTAIYLG